MPTNQNSKPISQMTPAELCEEANFLRTSMSDTAERLHIVYSHLHSIVRRSVEGDSVYAYLSVANVGKRFAGMVMQASRRSSVMEGRLTLAIQRENEEKTQRARDEARKRESSERRNRAREERADPLEALFGVVKPTTEVAPAVIDSELIPNGDLSSDLNDLYGEELV
jgi:hypothetical protein